MSKSKAIFLSLWRRNRWLTLSFVLTTAFAVFFTIRSVAFFIYWQNHFQEPIEGWMTVRYIAHSYRVDPRVIHDALELPEGKPDHRMLFEIARTKNIAIEKLAQTIIQDINVITKSKVGTAEPAVDGQ